MLTCAIWTKKTLKIEKNSSKVLRRVTCMDRHRTLGTLNIAKTAIGWTFISQGMQSRAPSSPWTITSFSTRDNKCVCVLGGWPHTQLSDSFIFLCFFILYWLCTLSHKFFSIIQACLHTHTQHWRYTIQEHCNTTNTNITPTQKKSTEIYYASVYLKKILMDHLMLKFQCTFQSTSFKDHLQCKD